MSKIKNNLSPEWAKLYNNGSNKHVDIVMSIISIIFAGVAAVLWIFTFN